MEMETAKIGAAPYVVIQLPRGGPLINNKNHLELYSDLVSHIRCALK